MATMDLQSIIVLFGFTLFRLALPIVAFLLIGEVVQKRVPSRF